MSEDFARTLRDILPSNISNQDVEAKRLLQMIAAAGATSSEGLLAIVRDPAANHELREIAGSILVSLRDARATAGLLSMLKDERTSTRAAAARLLGETADDQALRPLIDTLLNDSAPDVRRFAAYGLGQLANGQAVDAMLVVLRDRSEPPQVRAMVAEQLYKFRDDRVIPHLVDGLRDPVPDVRFWAAFALGRLGATEAVPELQATAVLDREIIPEVGSIQLEAVEAIRWIRSLEMYETTEVILGRLRESGGSYRDLVATVGDSSAPVETRLLAAHALGDLMHLRAVPALVTVLRDYSQDTELRRAAAAALGRMGGQRAQSALTSALKEDPVVSVRESAIEALGEIGGASAVLAFRTVLQAPGEVSSVKARAAQALYELHDCSEAAVFREALRDGSVAVRSWAIRFFGECGSSDIAPELERIAATDRDTDQGLGPLRQAAESALYRIRSRPAGL